MKSEGIQLQQLAFIALMLLYAGLLSLRPIPSTMAANDSGRYVAEFQETCGQPLSRLSDRGLAWSAYSVLNRPLCWVGDQRLYLLVAALALPMAFLLFGHWENGAVIWAIAAVIGVHGFELMTNALRQGASLFFLLWAINQGASKRLKWLPFLVSALLHVSAILFLPLLTRFALRMFGPTRLQSLRRVFFGSLVLAVVGLIWLDDGQMARTISFFSAYQEIYAEQLSSTFVIFMIAPIYWTYFARLVTATDAISSLENVTILLVSSLLLFCVFFAPFIAFRVAIAAGILQLFVGMIGSRSCTKAGILIAVGYAVHLSIYISFSEYAQKVLLG